MAGERTRGHGELEAAVMRILWERDDPMSARQVQEAFTADRPAYSTVMTALQRLHAKGDVSQSAESPRKVRFQAAHSGADHTSSTMMSALDESGDRQAALLRFAGNLAADDVELLREAMDTGRRPRKK